MATGFLFDTDVLVEYLRGREPAGRFMERLEGDFLVSAITVAELYSGVKGAKEEQALEQFLSAFDVLPVDDAVARRAGVYRQRYGKSHGTGLADALIAGTAEGAGAVLVTFNRRHYPMVAKVKVPYRRG